MIPTIYIQNLSLSYQEKVVFTNLNCTIHANTWISLLGPSGVGKTSFLRTLAALTDDAETVTGSIVASNQLAVHTQISYMAQTDLLLPWLTVIDNVLLSIRLRKHTKSEALQKKATAIALLEKVGLQHDLHLYPKQLSGGMRQRVALVRTLLEDKPIILMDEPFSALDAITRYHLQALTVELLKHKTVILITHDPLEALRLSDAIYLLQGNPVELKLFKSLTTAKPRDLNDSSFLQLQHQLYQALAV